MPLIIMHAAWPHSFGIHQAELRAHVFLAIDEEEAASGGEGELQAGAAWAAHAAHAWQGGCPCMHATSPALIHLLLHRPGQQDQQPPAGGLHQLSQR